MSKTLQAMPLTSKLIAEGKIKVPDVTDVTVTVTKADGIKCPRCWNYHTIQGNPKDVCDRCVVVVTQMLPELVADGRWTEADAEEWRGMVRNMVNRWKAKT